MNITSLTLHLYVVAKQDRITTICQVHPASYNITQNVTPTNTPGIQCLRVKGY